MSIQMTATNVPDEILIIELLEVLIYAILYQRRAYPEVIFRKVSMYRTTVFTTIFPPLQTYVKNVLSSALKLLEDDKLRSVCVLFSDEENKSRLLELHTFDLYDIYELLANVQKNYHAFTEYEEKIRACLLTMNAKCKNLVSLPTRFTFSIKLVTTQSGFAKLANDVNQQVFPWIKSDEKPAIPTGQLIPLLTLENINLTAESYI